MKYSLSLIFSLLIFLSGNGVFANDIVNNTDITNKYEISGVNNQSLKANRLLTLKKQAADIQSEIDKNKKQIEFINQVIFFYSDKNITDIVEAVKNSEIETMPVMHLEGTDIGYPIYNGALKKVDKLLRNNYHLTQQLKSTQKLIAEIESQQISHCD